MEHALGFDAGEYIPTGSWHPEFGFVWVAYDWVLKEYMYSFPARWTEPDQTAWGFKTRGDAVAAALAVAAAN